MKIRAIQIARFGVWQQLSLAVPGRGLALFYGPNEAGKTTLSRFIRSVLYGFEPFAVELCDGSSRPVGWEGLLRVESQGHEYEIRRISDRGTRGLVSVVGMDREQPAESLLSELLHRTDEGLFENVFAVGLNELQELATLQGDEVARHIYGLTLGPTGRKLLEATAVVEQERRHLLDPASRSGRLADLLEREQSLREEIGARHSLREEHAELCRERGRIQERIETLQQSQADVARQLSGHRILVRVWPHWSEAREIRRELEAIPEISGFPADGLERLEKLDAQIGSATESRRTLVESVKACSARNCIASPAIGNCTRTPRRSSASSSRPAGTATSPSRPQPRRAGRTKSRRSWIDRSRRWARTGRRPASNRSTRDWERVAGSCRRPPGIGPPSGGATG